MVRASYKELVSFVRYYNHSGTPVIVGGWAVFFYNPYYGSVDIDVVGPNFDGSFYELIEGYEISHDYEIARQDPLGTERVAHKAINSEDGNQIGVMEIDACSYEQPGVSEFHEDNTRNLPYSTCEKKGCKREVRIEDNCVCYVPSKPLLTLFKVKARRDRSYDVSTKGATMNPARLTWLRTKIIKDGSDIIALLDSANERAMLSEKMDYGQLKMLASDSNITDLVLDTLRGALQDRGVLSQYGKAVNVRRILKQITRLET
jgi:hypothetical protein